MQHFLKLNLLVSVHGTMFSRIKRLFVVKWMNLFFIFLQNQIQRKLVAKSKELTDDEILEREMIQFYSKEGDSSEEDSNENKQKM